MTPEATVPNPIVELPVGQRHHRTLAELAAEQGIRGPQNFEAIFGAGADLWDSEADFEAFQAGLQESRRTG